MAQYLSLPATLAIKKVKLGREVSDHHKTGVMKEAQLMKQIQGQHFIKHFHSFFETDEQGYCVFCILMEFAEKGDLKSYYIQPCRDSGGYVAECEIWKACEAISHGLMVLHEKKIIHRDIKLQNVLVMADGSFKIADMGISKSVANVSNRSLSISKVGTPLYTSPEQLRS